MSEPHSAETSRRISDLVKQPRRLGLKGLVAGLCLIAILSVAGSIHLLDALTGLFTTNPVAPTAAMTPAPAVPVALDTAKLRATPIYLTGLGTVQGFKTVSIRPRVDGELQKIGFVEGQDVKRGDLIAEIDPRPLRAQKAQTEAQLARDQALLTNAKLDLERYSSLVKSEFTSHQTFDTQKSLVAQYQAAIKTDQAQLDYADVQLGYTTITSPLSGRTGVRLIDEGNIVHASDPTGIVVITQIEPIAAIISIPEDSMDDVRAAMARGPVAIEAYGRTDTKARAEGTLELVDNQIDQSTGSLKLKATFPNTDHALWPGQFINVHVRLETRKDGITVPSAAIQRGPDGTYVYKVQSDQTAVIAPVSVAQIRDGYALIGSGLADGDAIVIDGQYKIKPGIHVIDLKQAGAAP